MLTTEHTASSYGQPVLVAEDNGEVIGTEEQMPTSYIHLRRPRADYSQEQMEWLDDLIVRQFNLPYEHRWHFGATCKTAEQLRRIESNLGRKVALA